MPMVHVEMLDGRSLDQKRALVRGITDVVARECRVDPAGVHVLIHELSSENWADAGTLERDRATGDSLRLHADPP